MTLAAPAIPLQSQQALEWLRTLRRHIHAHPELSFEEHNTSDLVAAKLAEWGYTVHRGIGGHGLVGVLKVGDGKRAIGLRADMDALPLQEHTELPYASAAPGKMHACGHDGHTAVLLGAARQLAETRRFNGTLNLVFQPAEEASGDSGAYRMLRDGLFDRFPCDAIYGLHNHPGAPAGRLMFRAGAAMASQDLVTIVIEGKGSHAARPHEGVDPVVAASATVLALQTIVSRNIEPGAPAVVTVATLHAGTANNIIPQSAELQLSVRTFDPKVREQTLKRIVEIAEGQAASYGCKADARVEAGCPVVVNAERETAFARAVAESMFGADAVGDAPLLMGSEDFAYFLEQKAGCFLRLGNGENSAMLHNPRYDFNDDALAVGVAFWVGLAETYLV